jgi:hypothetical protein
LEAESAIYSACKGESGVRIIDGVGPVLLQVVGLRNGYQTALVMAGLTTKIHAKRLAQGTEILLELRAGGVPPLLSLSSL